MEEMTGIQMTTFERLREITRKIRDGAYGQGDDFDTDSLDEDLGNMTADL